tara:strand:- start:349 stop:459 length:111 start_codon:yes stop_codon:yes gene_type:complete
MVQEMQDQVLVGLEEKMVVDLQVYFHHQPSINLMQD